MTTATAPAPTNGREIVKAPEASLAQIATRPAKGNIPDLRRMLLAKRPELEDMVGKDAAARFCAAIVTETVKNDKLLDCSIQSLVSCAIEASRLRLEIGGPLGQLYMVPYKGVAQPQVGYRGLVTLAHRSRRVSSVCSVIVRPGDEFEIIQGTERKINHKPAQPPSKDWIGCYAVVQYKGGGMDFEYMTKEQVIDHRNRFSVGWKYKGKDSVWGQHEEQMALKTPLRRLLKRCPIGVDLGPDEVPSEPEVTLESLPAAETHRQIETIDAADMSPEQREQLRQVEDNQRETPDTEKEAVLKATELTVLVSDIEKLAVAARGSWEAVRTSGLMESVKFKGTRAKELTLEQAQAVRVLLQAEVDAKTAPTILQQIDTLIGQISAREETEGTDIECDVCRVFGAQSLEDIKPEDLPKVLARLQKRYGA